MAGGPGVAGQCLDSITGQHPLTSRIRVSVTTRTANKVKLEHSWSSQLDVQRPTLNPVVELTGVSNFQFNSLTPCRRNIIVHATVSRRPCALSLESGQAFGGVNYWRMGKSRNQTILSRVRPRLVSSPSFFIVPPRVAWDRAYPSLGRHTVVRRVARDGSVGCSQ